MKLKAPLVPTTLALWEWRKIQLPREQKRFWMTEILNTVI
jgi:hypothetical protein